LIISPTVHLSVTGMESTGEGVVVGDALSIGSRGPSSPENEGYDAQGEMHEDAVSGPNPLPLAGEYRQLIENSLRTMKM
jgi:hypothetical protein